MEGQDGSRGGQARQRYPMVVFLHAYEERGEDGEHLAVGIGPALAECEALYGQCYVLMPQCPVHRVWATVDRPWAAGLAGAEEHITAAVEAACAALPVDQERIALTGASMGGYGTFVYGARHAARFRVFAPVCGGGIPAEAGALADRPVWAVHAPDDDVVPLSESRDMIDAIRAASADPAWARLTMVAGAGHAVWDVAYRDPAFARFVSCTNYTE